MYVVVQIDELIYKIIREYLLKNNIEQVVFLFSKYEVSRLILSIEVVDYYLLEPYEYEYQSEYHVEISDACQAKIIKRAWDNRLSLGEIHSHPNSDKANFSSSDLLGFKEFVPHIWWRLKQKPYFAMVHSQSDVDAIAWVESPSYYQSVEKLKLGSTTFYSDKSVINLIRGKNWKLKSFLDKFHFLG